MLPLASAVPEAQAGGAFGGWGCLGPCGHHSPVVVEEAGGQPTPPGHVQASRSRSPTPHSPVDSHKTVGLCLLCGNRGGGVWLSVSYQLLCLESWTFFWWEPWSVPLVIPLLSLFRPPPPPHTLSGGGLRPYHAEPGGFRFNKHRRAPHAGQAVQSGRPQHQASASRWTTLGCEF